MLYLIAMFWPVLVLTVIVGMTVGWLTSAD